MPTMREALDRVPWAELHHAYGPATDTPGHLLALLSSNPVEHERALDKLWGSICHQGSVYEASCAAVPFLIRILREGPAGGRPGVLSLLAGLAHRDWHADRNVRVLTIEVTYDEQHRGHSRHDWWCPGEFLTRGNKYHAVEWMARAHALVAEGLPDYLALLTAAEDGGAPDGLTARLALHLLAAFPEAGETVVPAIEAQLADEAHAGDEVFAAEALLDLGALLPSDSLLWDRQLACLAAERGAQRHALVRYAAAVAVARYRPMSTPPEAVTVLVDATVRPEWLDEQHELLGGSGYFGSVHVEACQLLSLLPAPQSVEALIVALDRGAGRWRVLDTIRVAEALLDAAFFGGWVQGWAWSHTIPRPADVTRERVSHEIIGDMRPYEERSYHSYGRSYTDGEAFTSRIECFGYVREEAGRLSERWTGGEEFTADQRHALEAVLRCAPLWGVPHDLLAIYGLPGERDALEALLSRG